MKTKYAKIKTRVPGPKSRDLLQRKSKAIPAGAYHNIPIFVESAGNALIRDVDGNTYIDFAAGIGVLNVGHAQPRVVQAAARQLKKFTHTCFHLTMYEPFVQLAETLNRLVPGEFDKKTYFANSGAEAVENAIKIARYATGRPAVLAFEHGFHGRTLLSMSLTGKVMPYKKGFGPFAPEIYHLPYPYCYRCEVGPQNGRCCMASEEKLMCYFTTHIAPSRIAAIVFEPVLGEGGIVPMNQAFVDTLFTIARTHGILLIADEIQTGWGRTGKLFAMEHFGLAPDITVSAKSLGGGLPISAITGRTEVMDKVHAGGIGGTFAGNPVSCSAALAAVEVIQKEKLADRAEKIGQQVRAHLQELQTRYEMIGDVRGMGAMNGVEFVIDRTNKRPAPDVVAALQRICYENGLIVLKAGSFGNVIRLLMPLTIEEKILQEGLQIFSHAVDVVANGTMA
ncbi:MAG: 4-aminobutyrate--2-oxoglutarate transaminase [Calditrichaeota bacterium]|nr:MAG: 4-aminobutyrate--2-oxoglutarate transaminase [Calditrichota bacterium]